MIPGDHILKQQRYVIGLVNILAESIQQATDGRGVEEGHALAASRQTRNTYETSGVARAI